MGEMIKLTAKDGATIGAYKAKPNGKPRGGIVVLQEIFGVNHHIRKVADGFALAGYLVIAPALFDRVAPDVELGYVPEDIKQRNGDPRPHETRRHACRHRSGGRCRLGRRARRRRRLLLGRHARLCRGNASVTAFPPPSAITDRTSPAMRRETLLAPTQFHFGERDKSIPPEDIEKIREAHPDSALYIYPADHGFSCSERESYDAQSAEAGAKPHARIFRALSSDCSGPIRLQAVRPDLPWRAAPSRREPSAARAER